MNQSTNLFTTIAEPETPELHEPRKALRPEPELRLEPLFGDFYLELELNQEPR